MHGLLAMIFASGICMRHFKVHGLLPVMCCVGIVAIAICVRLAWQDVRFVASD